jgi:phospholipid/cholesterol/gamma-HCH transport system ATP-binding protein
VSHAPNAVVFDRVSKSFGTRNVLREVSFQVRPGEALCILGRSGMGKRVTLKLTIALLKPDGGDVWIEQDDIAQLRKMALSRVRRKMEFLFQDADCSIP